MPEKFSQKISDNGNGENGGSAIWKKMYNKRSLVVVLNYKCSPNNKFYRITVFVDQHMIFFTRDEIDKVSISHGCAHTCLAICKKGRLVEGVGIEKSLE